MRLILCGADMPPAYRKKLEARADRVAVMPPCADVRGPTATHPDMLGYAAGGRLFLACGYYRENREFFDRLGCRIVPCGVTYGDYPRDIYFNVFALGGVLFGRTDLTPPEIAGIYDKCILLRQGYAKCSSLVMDNAVVTADRGIARAVCDNGGEALLISPGSVLLRGYGTGFIGGATAVPGDGTVIPVGDLDTHPDAAAVRDLAARHGFTVDDGTPGEPLYDCGGILTLDF